MKNLYELKRKKEELVTKYSDEHDFEIGYQMFYNFLINDFYNCLIGILDSYSKKVIDNIDDVSDYRLSIKGNTLVYGFISKFLSDYDLGYCVYDVDNNNNLIIKIILKPDFDNARDSFYSELQNIEYTLKSKEEMSKELSNFKKTR